MLHQRLATTLLFALASTLVHGARQVKVHGHNDAKVIWISKDPKKDMFPERLDSEIIFPVNDKGVVQGEVRVQFEGTSVGPSMSSPRRVSDCRFEGALEEGYDEISWVIAQDASWLHPCYNHHGLTLTCDPLPSCEPTLADGTKITKFDEKGPKAT